MRAFRMLTGAIALVALLAPTARAQDTAEVRRLTIMTFSEPVQLPGITLPAGTYRFEMADVESASHTVRVLSEDGQKVLATLPTMSSTNPTRDLRDTDTLVMFSERPAGQPQAVREWFYPQRSIGEEFIYPREQAQALANANRTSVAARDAEGNNLRVEPEGATAAAGTAGAQSPGTQASDDRAAATAQDQTAAQGAQQTQAPAPAQTPDRAATTPPAEDQAPAQATQQAQSGGTAPSTAQTGETDAGSQPVGTAGQTQGQQPTAQEPARTLPRTASQLALWQVLSGLSLAAAFGVRRMRMRAAARQRA